MGDRRSRRRILWDGAAGIGAAALAGAAGRGFESPGSTVAAPVAQPRAGGAVTFQLPFAPPSFDPFAQTSLVSNGLFGLIYSRLLRFRAGTPDVAPGDLSLEPDLAAAMPEMPDRQTYIVTLKPATFHDQPPLDGRAVSAEDARLAFDRYQNHTRSAQRSLLDAALTEHYGWGQSGRAFLNNSYVNDPELNDLLERQRAEVIDEERRGLIRRIEDLLGAQQYRIYLNTDSRAWFWDPTVVNYRPTAFFPLTHFMKMWKDGV